ncbi:MAG TPA: hypothetical protein VJ825_12055 [Gemmatimonadaceae bacterium]|nr:hypothetical protein [Gemmatimonadaceae bacterium]
MTTISPILFGVAAMTACEGKDIIHYSLSTTGPVGSYTAIILYSTSATDPTVKTPNSGSFTINLAADGTTSGHLHLEPFNGNPALDADMAGTWTRNGDQVEFQQPADTFVGNMTFTIEQINDSVWFLVGDDVFDATRFNVTLAQDLRD